MSPSHLLSAAAPSSARNIPTWWLPLVCGVTSALVSLLRWGGLSPPATFHDEAAYLLQAKIFASGRLAATAPPLPEFFEQFHVLVTPHLAPKYFPGHALLSTPGVLLGLPALGPIALNGLAGALVFAIGRRVAGLSIAALGWALWTTSWRVASWQSTYLSVTSSTALFLMGCYLLLRWWEEGRHRHLLALSFVTCFLAITRPLTAVAFALPAAGSVVIGARRRSLWSQIPGALISGLLVLAIIPLWNHASTGSWGVTPYGAYARTYLPWDRYGFDDSAPKPERPLPADMSAYASGYRRMRAHHAPAHAASILVARMSQSFEDLFGVPSWRWALALGFPLGLTVLDRRGRFALAWPLTLFALHLPRAHFTQWSVYYVEVLWIVALVTAAGLCAAIRLLLGERRRSAQAAVVAAVVLALAATSAIVVEPRLQAWLAKRRAYFAAFEGRLSELPRDEKTIVFVRYAPAHNPHRSLIENPADFARARHWVARDRGDDNRRLVAIASGRKPYLFDESSFQILPLEAVETLHEEGRSSGAHAEENDHASAEIDSEP